MQNITCCIIAPHTNIKFIEKVMFVCIVLVIYCTIQLFRFGGVYWKSIFPESRQTTCAQLYNGEVGLLCSSCSFSFCKP